MNAKSTTVRHHGRALSPLKRKPKFFDFLTYDLEWYPNTQVLRAVGVYDGSRFRVYRTIESFLRAELVPENAGKRFYAHAGGLFDVTYVLHYIILRENWQVEGSFSGSSAVSVTVRREGKRYTFADSYFLLRASLEKIGRWIGERKGTDVGSENPDEAEQVRLEQFFAPMGSLVKYLEKDCVILWNALRLTQVELYNLGAEMKITAASTGMSYFRSRYLLETIPTSDAINRVGRESYAASRVERRLASMRNAYCFDINSSFPYAMTFPLPGAVKTTLFGELPRGNLPYIARVKVRVPEIDTPPTPFRLDGRVYFPVGSWGWVWLTGVDIELLLEMGGTLDAIDRVIVFEAQTYLSEYALEFYEKRKEEKDPFRRELWKILMNACYGKFAENEEKTSLRIHPKSTRCRHRPPCDRYNEQTGEWETDTCMELLFPGVYLETKKKPIPHVHVPIASYITAIARRTLYRWLIRCGDWGYTNTDSIYTYHAPEVSEEHPYGVPGGIPTGKGLGELKFDPPKPYKFIRFTALKLYRGVVEGSDQPVIKSKGFPGLDDELFSLLESGFDVGFRGSMKVKGLLQGAARSGDPRDTRPQDTLVFKGLRGQVRDKRCMEKNGSRPWHIDELVKDSKNLGSKE